MPIPWGVVSVEGGDRARTRDGGAGRAGAPLHRDGSYGLRVGAGYVQTERHWDESYRRYRAWRLAGSMLGRQGMLEAALISDQEAVEQAVAEGWLSAAEGYVWLGEQDRLRQPKRGDRGWSRRSRMAALRKIADLPWDRAGDRMAIVTLTYPANWQGWVPNGRKLGSDLESFKKRWERRWGSLPVGVWCKEFQESGRPHLHLYVGLPAALSEGDYLYLRDRTVRCHALERRYGTYEGRARRPVVGGEFGQWALSAWCSVVGTAGSYQEMKAGYFAEVPVPDRTRAAWLAYYHRRGGGHFRAGVDVRVWYFADRDETRADRVTAANYVAKEVAKKAQKAPPQGFTGVGNYFGVWGEGRGFRPDAVPVLPLTPAEFEALTRRLRRWVVWRMDVRRRREGWSYEMRKENPWRANRNDGVIAFGMGAELRAEQWQRLEAYARRAVERQRGG